MIWDNIRRSNEESSYTEESAWKQWITKQSEIVSGENTFDDEFPCFSPAMY